MKKQYKFNELSNVKCIKCGKKLKMNLVSKKPTAKICYACLPFNPGNNTGGKRKVSK
jgi:hypothetical protein